VLLLGNRPERRGAIQRISPALTVGAAVWLVSVVALIGPDRGIALIAVSTALYAAILAALTWWLVPKTVTVLGDDTLRAHGAPLPMAFRYTVVGAAIVWIIGSNVVAAAGVNVPLFSAWRTFIGPAHPLPFIHGGELQNFLMEALVPGLLLLALGASRRQLGLVAPVHGTLRATLACLVLPIVFVVIGFVHGKLNLFRLFWLLIVRNLISNGFSEEFVMRGAVMSHLRGFWRADVALVAQALIFAVLHFGIGDEHGNPALIVANVIALNFPTGLVLGFMALRTRSLVMPSVVHMSLDAMKDMVM
jgi:membrane protease YdiL (CAAX protease family)